MDGDKRRGSVQQVERVAELNILRAVRLADVECRADLLHLFLRAQGPQTLELSVVERQADGDDLG